MDWSEHMQNIMQSWAEAQQRMWSSWLESTERMSGSQSPDIWAKTVKTWRESVDRTLDAQAEWLQTWADGFQRIEGAPKEVADWAEEGRAMIKRWNDAQRELWDQWFEMLEKSQPGSAFFAHPEQAQDLIQTWQDTARRAMESQMQWAAGWTKAGGGQRRGGAGKGSGRGTGGG